jgi:hypothetical protein
VTYLLLVNVVREMRRVPDHHILVADTLSAVEAAKVSLALDGCIPPQLPLLGEADY